MEIMMNLRRDRRGGFGLLNGLLMLAVAALLLASFIGGRLSMNSQGPQTVAASDEHAGHDHAAEQQADAEAEAETDGDAEEIIYQCPMHPEQQSTDPAATCPICGMDMTPMGGDAADAGQPVLRLSDRSRKLLNVQVMPVERRAVEVPLGFVGRLGHDERLVHDVVVRSESYVEKLHADYLYKPVAEGEVLAEVYSPQVNAAVRELRVVRDAAADSGRQATSLEAARAKVQRLGVSADQVEQLLASDDVGGTYQIRSPIAGHVMALSGREGYWLDEGQQLVRIMDPSNLWVQLEAYERDLQWLEVGLPVELTVEAYPGETFEGEVAFVDPMVDERSRTSRVRLNVPNPDDRLKPGMFVRATIRGQVSSDLSEGEESDEASGGLVIPASAPLLTGRRAVVYVQEKEAEQPTYRGREVVLGPRVGEYYMVREGLSEGELVVTHGAFKIDSELQISGRPSMMAAGGITGERDDPTTGWQVHQVPEAFAGQVAEAVEGYFAISEALAEDDLEAARQAVAGLRERIVAIDAEPLQPSTREAWQPLAARLDEATTAMAEAEKIDALRREMAALSEGVTELAVRFGGEQVGPLYRMHCPMAHDDAGAYWLQADEELRNPYMGERMLRCGTLEQTLHEH